MNQKQAGLLFVVVGVLAAGLAFLTAPMLASLLGAVESYSEDGGVPPAKNEAAPSLSADPGPLGSDLPKPTGPNAGSVPLGAVDAEAPFSPGLLQDKLLALAPQVRVCRDAWDEQAGSPPAEIVVLLTLTPTGLNAAALETLVAPSDFRSCLGAAIWQTRWPAPEAAATLRYPLVWDDKPAAKVPANAAPVEPNAEPRGEP